MLHFDATFLHNRNGEPINSLEDWHRLAPPKRPKLHWKPGRSALELAKAWFRKGFAAVPDEIGCLLDTQQETSGFQIREAIPELKTRLDAFRGETRNHDILFDGDSASGRVVVTIEAKADEDFGPEIGTYRKSKEGTRSNIPLRINALSKSIFGREPDDEIDLLRYQLLHSLAAGLIEATERDAKYCVLIIHQFNSSKLTERKCRANHRDLERFVEILSSNKISTVESGRLHGPFLVPSGGHIPSRVPIFIGKVVVDSSG